MAQVVYTMTREPDRRPPRPVGLLKHPRAAWWAAVLTLSGMAQAAFFVLFAMGFSVYMVTVLDRKQPTEHEALLVLVLSLALAVAVGIYLYRNEKDLEPPRKRVPRKRWGFYANGTGAIVFLGVAYATWWVWLVVVGAVLRVARLIFPIPHLGGAAFFAVTVSVPLLLAVWGFVAWRHELLRLMETGQPPELRFATNVIRVGEEFLDRAKALERAMEEAAGISKQVQRGIEADRQQLAQLREQYRQELHLKDLTDEELAAVRSELTQDNARARRWSLWFSLLLTLVGWAIGVLTNALIDNQALGNQLRQWLNLS